MQPHQQIIAAIIVATLFSCFVNLSAVRAEEASTRVMSDTVLAQTPPARSADQPGPPPREAISACESKTQNTVCTFSGRDGQSVSGTCSSPETDRPLACTPTTPPKKG